LVVDEIKVGMGRTGEWWSFEHAGVTPDFITVGKSLGGGLPLSAIVGRGEVLDTATGVALFTTSGNALSCAAGVGTVQAIRQDNLVQNAREVGAYLHEKLLGLQEKHEMIGDVRGLGMIQGLELVRDRATKKPVGNEIAKVVFRAFELGLLVFYVATATTKVMEITPPLILTKGEVDEGIAILDQAFSEVAAGEIGDDVIARYAGW
jgi:4-aminobutyrate aminotransferase